MTMEDIKIEMAYITPPKNNIPQHSLEAKFNEPCYVEVEGIQVSVVPLTHPSVTAVISPRVASSWPTHYAFSLNHIRKRLIIVRNHLLFLTRRYMAT